MSHRSPPTSSLYEGVDTAQLSSGRPSGEVTGHLFVLSATSPFRRRCHVARGHLQTGSETTLLS